MRPKEGSVPKSDSASHANPLVYPNSPLQIDDDLCPGDRTSSQESLHLYTDMESNPPSLQEAEELVPSRYSTKRLNSPTHAISYHPYARYHPPSRSPSPSSTRLPSRSPSPMEPSSSGDEMDTKRGSFTDLFGSPSEPPAKKVCGASGARRAGGKVASSTFSSFSASGGNPFMLGEAKLTKSDLEHLTQQGLVAQEMPLLPASQWSQDFFLRYFRRKNRYLTLKEEPVLRRIQGVRYSEQGYDEVQAVFCNRKKQEKGPYWLPAHLLRMNPAYQDMLERALEINHLEREHLLEHLVYQKKKPRERVRNKKK